MNWFQEFVSAEEGQGITEYACVLAFVSLLIIMVFSITQGTFADAVFGAYSSMAREIGRLCEAASNN